MLFLRVSVACPASSANLAVLEPTSPLLFTRRTCHYRWSPTKTTPILRSQAGACAQPAPINLAGGLARHVTATAHCDSDAAGWPQWSIGQHGAGRLGCLAAHWNDNRRDARSQRTRDSPVLNELLALRSAAPPTPENRYAVERRQSRRRAKGCVEYRHRTGAQTRRKWLAAMKLPGLGCWCGHR
jgi:hypothetical protein